MDRECVGCWDSIILSLDAEVNKVRPKKISAAGPWFPEERLEIHLKKNPSPESAKKRKDRAYIFPLVIYLFIYLFI